MLANGIIQNITIIIIHSTQHTFHSCIVHNSLNFFCSSKKKALHSVFLDTFTQLTRQVSWIHQTAFQNLMMHFILPRGTSSAYFSKGYSQVQAPHHIKPLARELLKILNTTLSYINTSFTFFNSPQQVIFYGSLLFLHISAGITS